MNDDQRATHAALVARFAEAVLTYDPLQPTATLEVYAAWLRWIFEAKHRTPATIDDFRELLAESSPHPLVGDVVQARLEYAAPNWARLWMLDPACSWREGDWLPSVEVWRLFSDWARRRFGEDALPTRAQFFLDLGQQPGTHRHRRSTDGRTARGWINGRLGPDRVADAIYEFLTAWNGDESQAVALHAACVGYCRKHSLPIPTLATFGRHATEYGIARRRKAEGVFYYRAWDSGPQSEEDTE